MKNKKKGFSLVELLIVLGISSILMAMSAPKYQGIVGKANELEQRAYIREALNYVDVYNLEASAKIEESKTLKEVPLQGSDFEAARNKVSGPNQEKTLKYLREFTEGVESPSS
ncbi:MAG TPA: hypothetical protein DEF30_02590 [Proteiniclasticum sp.]|uniref:type II secretion system protein n=1 Tax=Proteiniclasticum sp. TaxID=2053595 RepID=UPI000E8735A2|nr:type II secretion system protein [Proteiniclasticum sp.]HBW12700.1 hypothetical protein [Proteiniclasticum sp.]